MAQKSFRISWTVARTLLVAVCVLALTSPGWGGDKPAPSFTLKDVLTGKDYTLSQFKGKVVMLNFFTFFCGPCRDEMPDLNKINNELKGKGLQTLGIAISSDPTKIRFLVKQLGLQYPVLIGNDKVSEAYGSISVVPTTIIIDKQGNIAQRIEGTRKKAVFMGLVQPLL
jgi:cytochrome c biogenesis protein CcmG/thiol:disulfide interchange protein DsbE